MIFCFVCGDSWGHFCKALRQCEILSSGVLRKNLPGLMLVVTSEICAVDLAKTAALPLVKYRPSYRGTFVRWIEYSETWNIETFRGQFYAFWMFHDNNLEKVTNLSSDSRTLGKGTKKIVRIRWFLLQKVNSPLSSQRKNYGKTTGKFHSKKFIAPGANTDVSKK